MDSPNFVLDEINHTNREMDNEQAPELSLCSKLNNIYHDDLASFLDNEFAKYPEREIKDALDEMVSKSDLIDEVIAQYKALVEKNKRLNSFSDVEKREMILMETVVGLQKALVEKDKRIADLEDEVEGLFDEQAGADL